MKPFYYILLFIYSCQLLQINANYIESVNSIIEQRIKSITDKSILNIVEIAHQINNAIENKASLQQIYELLQSKKFISFFLLDASENIEDIKFALGAKIYLYYLDCCEQKMLYKLSKSYNSLDYWKHEYFCTNNNQLNNIVEYWFYNEDYKTLISEKIINLESIEHQMTSFLGLIRHNKQMCLKAVNQELFEQDLRKAALLQDALLHVAKRDYNDYDIYNLITVSMFQFYDFSKKLSAQYLACQPPQNIERNKIVYSSITVSLCTCAIIYYIYKNEIHAGIDTIEDKFFSLFKHKVQGPAEKILNTLSGAKNEPLLDTTREEKILRTLYEQGSSTPDPRGQDISLGQVIIDDSVKLLGDAAQRTTEIFNIWTWLGYDTPINKKELISSDSQSNYQKISNNQSEVSRSQVDQKDALILSYPNKNAGEVIPAILRSGLNFGVNIQNVINDLYEEHRLMLGIAAFLPAVAFTAGTLSAVNKAYTAFAYQPLRRIIRDLDIFLNNSALEQPSFDREGKLYFLTEELKKKSRVLSLKAYKFIQEDIAELQSNHLTYAQKFNIIQRMYHTYEFLLTDSI